MNTRGTNDSEVSKELVDFLHFAEKPNEGCGNVDSERIQRIARQVEKIKGDHEMGVRYMQTWEEKIIIREEGREEGRREILLTGVDNLMKKLGMTASEAMDILGVPADEKDKYLQKSGECGSIE